MSISASQTGARVPTPLEHMQQMIERNPAIRREYERLGPRYEVLNSLVDAQEAAGIEPLELARRMGVSRAMLYRMLSGETSPRIDALAAAAKALGCRLEVRFVPEEASDDAEPSEGAREAGRPAVPRKKK